MLGGIFGEGRCPLCGAKFVDLGEKYQVCCPVHKDQKAKKLDAKFGRTARRKFAGPNAYVRAHQWLGGLRAKAGDPETHGAIDPRDYDRERPLSIDKLIDRFLEIKQPEVSASQYRNLKNHLSRASAAWKGRSIKSIGYADIEDFLLDLNVSSKTRHNYKSAVHSFFVWAVKRYSKPNAPITMPEFPIVNVTLGTRKITDKASQLAVLERVRQDCANEPRKWIAIQFLCHYPALRPDDIRRIHEGDIDYRTGRVTIQRPTKNKKQRTIYLIPSDIELLRGLPRAMPHMPVFRHDHNWPPMVKVGDVFGKDLLYSIWREAATAVGLKDVSLYGGTRHTTVTDLQQYLGPDEIKEYGSQHQNNAAFARYFSPAQNRMMEVAMLAAGQAPGQVVPIRQAAAGGECPPWVPQGPEMQQRQGSVPVRVRPSAP
jgi:integrase